MIKKEDIKYYDYPNPRWRRKDYKLLDKECDFYIYDNETNLIKSKNKILLPFSYETLKSGINDQNMYKHVLYEINFEIDEITNYLLHFNAVDYECNVYLNDSYVGSHKGGFTSFSFDISKFIKKGNNVLKVDVHDSFSKEQLRGKQREIKDSHECWYVQTTGIYQSVYLEKCGNKHIEYAKFSGDENGNVNYEIKTTGKELLNVDICFDNKTIKSFTLKDDTLYKGSFKVDSAKLWSLNTPNLYDVKLTLNSSNIDYVETYFGFRSVKVNNGYIYLNNQKEFLKFILNQGYYKNQGLTLTKENILQDFNLMKGFGFNGCRIHQKVEQPLLYYLADRFGFLLWSELPSCYEYSNKMKEEINNDLFNIIDQNYNSPSIITYVIFNESWGIPQINNNEEVQSYVSLLKDKVKKYDDTRLVIANDGWFNLSNTDILSLHEYQQDANELYKCYNDKNNITNNYIVNGYGKAFANNNKYQNQPIMLTEFGGIAIQDQDGWGYGDKANNLDTLKNRMNDLFKAIYKLDYLSGFCYTQLADVEQETNGLVYENRKLKLPIDEVKNIVNGNYYKANK